MKVYCFEGDVNHNNTCRCGSYEKLPDENACALCIPHSFEFLVNNAIAGLISWDRINEVGAKLLEARIQEFDTLQKYEARSCIQFAAVAASGYAENFSEELTQLFDEMRAWLQADNERRTNEFEAHAAKLEEESI